jgi:multidrug efflux pump subunit AcrA (membrane-fusion protein)
LDGGTRVKKGQVICGLDSSAFQEQLESQIISSDAAEAYYSSAKANRELAELAAKAHNEKTDVQSDRRQTLAVAESAVQKAIARLNRAREAQQRIRVLLDPKRDAVTAVEIAAELDVAERVECAEEDLANKKAKTEEARLTKREHDKFGRERTAKELSAEVEQRRAIELAKKGIWTVEKRKQSKLEQMVRSCMIVAPNDGVVGFQDPDALLIKERTVREKEVVFRLASENQRYLTAQLDRSLIDHVNRNRRMRISEEGSPRNVRTGTFTPMPGRDGPQIIPQQPEGYERPETVYLAIDEGQPGFLPDTVARVELLLANLENVLIVPRSAIASFAVGDRVAIKRADGGFAWQGVALGARNETDVEIKGGLRGGETILADPRAMMSDDEKCGVCNIPPTRSR